MIHHDPSCSISSVATLPICSCIVRSIGMCFFGKTKYVAAIACACLSALRDWNGCAMLCHAGWFVDAPKKSRFRRENDDESVTISDLKGTLCTSFRQSPICFESNLQKTSRCVHVARGLKRALYLDPFEWIISYNLGVPDMPCPKFSLFFLRIEYVVGQAWCISILDNLLPHFWLVKKNHPAQAWQAWTCLDHLATKKSSPTWPSLPSGNQTLQWKMTRWRWFSHLNVHS
jgi:hypothetical protein